MYCTYVISSGYFLRYYSELYVFSIYKFNVHMFTHTYSSKQKKSLNLRETWTRYDAQLQLPGTFHTVMFRGELSRHEYSGFL